MKKFSLLFKSFLSQVPDEERLYLWLFVAGIIIILLAMFSAAFLAGIMIEKVKNRALLSEKLKTTRSDAIKRSRAVIGGQVTEQIAPFLPDFPCNPGDVRFVGKPIDFVAFPGAAEGHEIKEVLFIEVKTGDSKLSQREKEIRTAVEKGRVRYVVYNR